MVKQWLVQIALLASLEIMVGSSVCRRLMWSICLLHTNELPSRHLFIDLDGPNTGANSFQGVTGQLLPAVADMEWNPAFKPILAGQGLEDLPRIYSEICQVTRNSCIL